MGTRIRDNLNEGRRVWKHTIACRITLRHVQQLVVHTIAVRKRSRKQGMFQISFDVT
jgi:hypothetical protein